MPAKSRTPALYVYGLVRAGLQLDPGLMGIDEGEAVHLIRAGRAAAVVSAKKDRQPVLPSRRTLDVHQRVTSRLLEAGTILPFAFGHVARDERAVVDLLQPHEAAICAELDRLEGKVQMGLKVHWDVDDIFKTILEADPELAAFRDAVFTARQPTMAERIELGERFAESRNTRRAALVESLKAAFSMAVQPPEQLPVRGEKAVADLMFLIERRDVTRFEEQVLELANRWPAHYVFHMTGPWAPFNFVELDLDSAGREGVGR